MNSPILQNLGKDFVKNNKSFNVKLNGFNETFHSSSTKTPEEIKSIIQNKYDQGEPAFIDDERGKIPFLVIFTDGDMPKASPKYLYSPGNVIYVLTKETISNARPLNAVYLDLEELVANQ